MNTHDFQSDGQCKKCGLFRLDPKLPNSCTGSLAKTLEPKPSEPHEKVKTLPVFLVLMTHSTCETGTLEIEAKTPADAVIVANAMYPGGTPVVVGEVISEGGKPLCAVAHVVRVNHKLGPVQTLAVEAPTRELANQKILIAFPTRTVTIIEEDKKS